jgi:hypothetical protein
MVIFLITSAFLLAAVIFALYRWQRRASDEHAEYVLPPAPDFRGLFAEGPGSGRQLSDSADRSPVNAEQRAALLARAAAGERAALLDAQASNDRELYDEVLNVLVERVAASEAPEKGLLALVSYVTRHDFRPNLKLAEVLMESYKQTPDQSSTAKMLHLVALADDARLYERAVELAVQLWREGRLENLTAQELRALTDGEYWVLSQPVRSSGAGFMLKRKLAEVRRQLVVAEATHTQ